MLELGHYSEKGHRDVGNVVVEQGIDILITRGKDSHWIGEQARNWEWMQKIYILN